MAVSSSSLHNVFVYGSLMADEVVNLILERVPRSAPAILPEYQRYSLKGRVYPAIVPAEKKKVNGKEGHMQEDCSNWLNGHTYVWSNIHDPDLYGEWDYEEWRDIHMNEFLNMCRSFTSELKQSSTASRLSTCQSVIPGMESF